ncbi:hypothetical protein [Candidatus Marithrix sp. Canyon 246]|uniref:hypothetical protein n=1 Tax=Candidatus Marithrix sp. Canyon 246 TaxID=1827136 RepID=UPI00084A1E33|nr:hypothetical protein [Candidatus Marithrix sp. Canyon 246]
MKKVIGSILGISLLSSSVVVAHENEDWNLKPLGLDGIVKFDKEAPQFTGLLYSEQHSSDTVILKKDILPTTVGVECISKINPIVNSTSVKKEPLILAFVTAVLGVIYAQNGQLLPQGVLDTVKYERIRMTGSIFQKKEDSRFTVEIKAFGLSVIAQFSILKTKDSKGFPKVSCGFRNDEKINGMELESFRKYLTIQQHVNNSLELIKPFIREIKAELKSSSDTRALRSISNNFDEVMQGALMLAQPLVEVLDSNAITCSGELCDYSGVNNMFRTYSSYQTWVSGSDYQNFLSTYTPSSNVKSVSVINDDKVPDLENDTDAVHIEKVVKIPLKTTTFKVNGETIDEIRIVSSLNTPTATPNFNRSKIVVEKDNIRRCCSIIMRRTFFVRW